MGPFLVSVLGEIFLERGANLESRAAHTHPKNTQVPPPPGISITVQREHTIEKKVLIL